MRNFNYKTRDKWRGRFARVAGMLCLAAIAWVVEDARASNPKPRIRLPNLTTVNFDPIKHSRSDATIILKAELEQGLKLNSEAPSKYVVTVSPRDGEPMYAEKLIAGNEERIVVNLSGYLSTGEIKVVVDSVFYYCPVNENTVCFMKSYTFNLPFTVIGDQAEQDAPVMLQARLPYQGEQ